jgi:hypothetical protein
MLASGKPTGSQTQDIPTLLNQIFSTSHNPPTGWRKVCGDFCPLDESGTSICSCRNLKRMVKKRHERQEFEQLRDLPGKRITADIEFIANIQQMV